MFKKHGVRRGWRLLALVLAASLLALPETVAAHPLGNFSVNHYSRVEIFSDRLRVRYVLDMAEIPTFQAMASIDSDGDGQISAAEGDRYRLEKIEALRRGLSLTVNGASLALETAASELSFVPGQGDLKIMRLSGWFEALLASDAGALVSVEFRDHNPGRNIGWREIVVQPAQGIRLDRSTAPTQDTSDELRAYPDAMLNSPMDVRAASFAYEVVGWSAAPALSSAAALTAAGAANPFARLVETENLSPAVVGLALLAAAVYGALHAMTPGHGKTMVGAYLVGSRCTPRHALFLGLTVTLTHTLGVFLLGLVTLVAAEYILPEQLYPVLGTISGLLVVGLGASLFVSRLRAARSVEAGHGQHHAHGQDRVHDHDHPHSHDHDHPHAHSRDGHTHTHLPPEGQAITLRSLLALGISGGLVPCPTALLVLLGAMALNRVAFGLLLIVAFSVGLAAVLAATGLLLVWAGRLFERLPVNERAVRLVGALGALTMTLVGLGATFQSLRQWLA